MSESWKNRLWSLLLVCTFAFVLSVCNKAMDGSSDGSKSSSGGIAYADFKPSDVTHIMVCGAKNVYSHLNSNHYYAYCDASNDDSSIESEKILQESNGSNGNYRNVISFDTLANNGWRPCGTSDNNYLFCK